MKKMKKNERNKIKKVKRKKKGMHITTKFEKRSEIGRLFLSY
jgi:hypothetical protein